MAKNQTIQARVLTDNIALNLQCGQVVEGPEKIIKALMDAGAVDCHASAVTYALEQGAKVVALDDVADAESFVAAAVEAKDQAASE